MDVGLTICSMNAVQSKCPILLRNWCPALNMSVRCWHDPELFQISNCEVCHFAALMILVWKFIVRAVVELKEKFKPDVLRNNQESTVGGEHFMKMEEPFCGIPEVDFYAGGSRPCGSVGSATLLSR